MKNKKLVIFVLLTIVCAVTIFMLSGQEKKVSSANSLGVLTAIAEFIGKVFGIQITSAQVIGLHNIFRKSAHFTAYMILAIFSFNSFRLLFQNMKNSAVAALIFCILMAISDEIHQLFVPGRSGEVRDVLIDTLGACVGVLLVCIADIFVKIVRKKFKKVK